MGDNFHTAPTSSTTWEVTPIEAVLSTLDRGITYLKNIIVHCDGAITYSAGTLTWAGTLRILFNRSDGKAIQNTVAASTLALSDNEFAYVDLNETDGTVLTMQKAAVTTNAASNFITYNRLVLAYRNTG
jgi:hypothetical protein